MAEGFFRPPLDHYKIAKLVVVFRRVWFYSQGYFHLAQRLINFPLTQQLI